MQATAEAQATQEAEDEGSEWRSASALLRGAASLIKANGWQQGAAHAVPQDCIATALEKAFRADPSFTLVDLEYAKAALNQSIGTATALEAPIYWGAAYMDWNDAPERDVGEVLSAFNDAESRCLAAAP